MRFGILPPYRAGVTADPAWMARFARHAEAVGFESLYTVEHVVVQAGYAARYPYAAGGRMPLPDECPIPDPLDLLAFLAGVTERIVLATGILVLPEHHPVQLAKRLATIDALSGGRLRLGVGVGWMREEIEAVGVDFESRGARTDEAIEAMRALWREEEATYRGRFFSFERAISRPRPVQPGGVPIHVGGHSAAAARRAGRVGDGFQPLGLDGNALAERMSLVRAAALEAGRDPEAIELSLGGLLDVIGPDDVERAEEQGAARLVISTREGDLARLEAQMSAFAERVIHR
ncbi:LLM class F420-dependent oxidoreductase [Rhabdothermincola sediminis]|uniref:LLM class F420-dependent oxidoreductase n=1 Tax=Rhabdothermincola sediminis TaxID=2751370 RepID=UPI001AA05BB9|nr:LLM class F420-dependent oxidoreductase [Rhabdothermincola sediminis]